MKNKRQLLLRICYETLGAPTCWGLTPESIEKGESDSYGIELETKCDDIQDVINTIDSHLWGLPHCGASESGLIGSSAWFQTLDDEIDYETGETRRYSIHVCYATAEEMCELARALHVERPLPRLFSFDATLADFSAEIRKRFEKKMNEVACQLVGVSGFVPKVKLVGANEKTRARGDHVLFESSLDLGKFHEQINCATRRGIKTIYVHDGVGS